MRSRGHLSVPRTPPAGGATPNACPPPPRCPPLKPTPTVPPPSRQLPRPRQLATSPGGLAPAPIWAVTRHQRPLARSWGLGPCQRTGGWSRITGAKQGLTQPGHPHMARPVIPYRSQNPQRNAPHPPGQVSQSASPGPSGPVRLYTDSPTPVGG
ncbi:hypothetical protein N7444_001978 [Penicillium canescens]|nr:hypothetical protein N7444_001978 [Penicillium canescens]